MEQIVFENKTPAEKLEVIEGVLVLLNTRLTSIKSRSWEARQLRIERQALTRRVKFLRKLVTKGAITK